MNRASTREARWVGRPVGSAVDVAQETRPGVPRVRQATPDAGARWERPQQQRGTPVLGRSGLRGATAVFGTAQPARGPSGVVRRAAYRLPEHKTGRWLLLLAADRLDVLEHRVVRGLWVLPAAVGLAVGYLAVSRRLERR